MTPLFPQRPGPPLTDYERAHRIFGAARSARLFKPKTPGTTVSMPVSAVVATKFRARRVPWTFGFEGWTALDIIVRLATLPPNKEEKE